MVEFGVCEYVDCVCDVFWYDFVFEDCVVGVELVEVFFFYVVCCGVVGVLV